ncbi:MAG: hypothetical protein NTZ94_16840 [Verrucomicrobia bacterium]|nr:hypothetical protein [Verrucomicrobiota bacterium]
MSQLQPESSRIRLQPGARVDLLVTMPSPHALCSVAGPAGIKIKTKTKANLRKFSFSAPASPWSGTFLIAVAFLPDASGKPDMTESFKLQIDDPTTPNVDIDASTIRPRANNLDPIPFALDFVV